MIGGGGGVVFTFPTKQQKKFLSSNTMANRIDLLLVQPTSFSSKYLVSATSLTIFDTNQLDYKLLVWKWSKFKLLQQVYGWVCDSGDQRSTWICSLSGWRWLSPTMNPVSQSCICRESLSPSTGAMLFPILSAGTMWWSKFQGIERLSEFCAHYTNDKLQIP